MVNVQKEDEHPGSEALSYAIDRTVLANERTFAAWIRTGLTALAAGIAIEKFMVDIMPNWTIRSIAITLVVLSAISFWVAAWRYSHLGIKLVHIEVKAIPKIIATGMSIFLIVSSLLALFGIWLLDAAGGN